MPALALAVMVSCFVSGAQAQGRGRGHAKPATDHVEHAVVIDRDGHVRAIREYARTESLPPGLAKREQLPAGLRKQLHENGELPPGLQKRLVPVPAPLVVRLPHVPSYYQRYFAGDDLVVIDSRTHRIAAVVPDVWR